VYFKIQCLVVTMRLNRYLTFLNKSLVLYLRNKKLVSNPRKNTKKMFSGRKVI